MDIKIKPFDKLTVKELYDLLKLREEVFILEQNILYPDLDDTDQSAFHVMVTEDDKMVAYARVFPKGIKYKEASIGRVVTSPAVRGKGYGIPLMESAMDYLITLGEDKIIISAQAYAKAYYAKFGFKPTDKEPYLEDGIPHLEMIYVLEDE